MSETATPMMAQYLGIKASHPDALLFYRMGDFYELFFDDAKAAAAALDIALTKRGRHQGQDITMCGVPAHAAEGYLLTLIRKGFRVAVCDQVEDPAEARKRGAKSVVAREVTRVVTPGTLTEDTLLDARRANYLAAWAEVRGESALAWTDISTGELRVTPCPLVRLGPELARLSPAELLVPEGRQPQLASLAAESGAALTPLAPSAFDSLGAESRLRQLFGVGNLDGFGSFSRAELSALGGLVEYVELTQRGRLPNLTPPVREIAQVTLQIDAATRRNLELTRALSGGRDGSLLAAIDRTVTAAGARLLENRLAGPSCDPTIIAGRLDQVSVLVESARLRADLREDLREAPDIDRALSRLALDRGGPRDLAAIRAGIEAASRIAARLEGTGLAAPELGPLLPLGQLLARAVVAEPPLLARDGGFIQTGYDPELDETRRLRDQGRGVIAGLQAQYASLAGIAALKVRHNNVLGYFIETPDTHAKRMLAPPLSETFIHRQTTAGAVRFTTVELSDLETRILNAGNHAISLEQAHFAALSADILASAAALSHLARRLAELDLAAASADLAVQGNWCRPVLDRSRALDIRGGRHPVVEQALARQGGQRFVANDCDLTPTGDGAAVWCLTGPNMAGKSTFLRQNALIVLLAQAGFYVPAESARIGLVSQLFSRVGAADDLARGRSTFMVEMVETAAILNQADDRSLVILDEIGRGTATYDGLSIAWATLEHLHDVNRCRALFATHYHELTALADRLPGLANATVTVKEWQGEVVFLHEVRKGAADRSYGVQVARLAGLPPAVIERARVVLDALEKGDREGARPRALIDDLPLFSAAARPVPPNGPPKVSAVEERLRAILPDELTPRAALDLIYELRTLV